MAWVTPHEWHLHDDVTAADLDQDMIDSPLSMREMFDASALVYRTSDFTVATDTRTPIPWTTAMHSRGGVWAIGAPTHLVAPVDGVYLYVVNVPWTPDNTGRRGVGYELNDGTDFDLQFQSAQAGKSRECGADLIQMAADDYIEATAYQSTSGNLDLLGGGQQFVNASLTLVATATVAPLWTPPRNWQDGDVLTPWRLKTQIKDNLNNRRYFNGYAVKLSMESNLSISSGQRGGIPWDVQQFQVGDMWTGGATLTAKVAGWYGILATVEWRSEQVTSTGVFRAVGYRLNGHDPDFDLQKQSGVTAGQSTNGKSLIRLERDDTLEVYAYHDSDETSLTINGGTDRTRVCMWLEAAD